jgi:hypothetical protein
MHTLTYLNMQQEATIISFGHKNTTDCKPCMQVQH